MRRCCVTIFRLTQTSCPSTGPFLAVCLRLTKQSTAGNPVMESPAVDIAANSLLRRLSSLLPSDYRPVPVPVPKFWPFTVWMVEAPRSVNPKARSAGANTRPK